MSVRLFVGNLPYSATETELREHFSAVGQLSYIYLPTDRETGKPRGFAFVEFSESADAEEAIRRFNNQLFKGRRISVNEGRAKGDRPPPGTAPRSAPPRSFSSIDEPPPMGAPPARNFGPDAAPRNKRKPQRAVTKSERVPKGPIRERPGGRLFFGGDDDDLYDDAELEGENFASRESPAGDESTE